MPAEPSDTYSLLQANTDLSALRAQIDQMNEIIKLIDSGTDWANAGAGAWLYSMNGHLKSASTDTNNYDTERLTLTVPPANYAGTSVLTSITGLIAPVAAQKYRLDGDVIISNGSTGQAINLGLAGPAINDMRVQWYMFLDSPTAPTVFCTNSLNTITHFATPSLAGSTAYLCQVRGYISFSAPGTFGIQTSAVNAFTIVGDSFCDLMPVA